MAVQFTDNSAQVKAALDAAVIAYLHGAGGELAAQTARNTRRGSTGQTAGAWNYVVDEAEGIATIGNPLENSIWEEFGTGEYALHGDGRKGGWTYQDEKDGTWHHTYGKTPNRAFQSAFNSLKPALIKRAEEVLKGRME